MGKINQGILDGFKGKVGTVVGFFWKGKPVMRGYKRFIHDRHTDAQMAVRLRFAIVNELAQAFHAAALLGLAHRAKSRANTELNNFVQLNFDAVSANHMAEVDIDYSALVLSAGSLPAPLYGTASFQTPQQVELPYAAGSEQAGTSDDDMVYLVAYNPSAGTAAVSAGDKRSALKASLAVPAAWSGEKVHLYAFAVGGSSSNRGQASRTSYLGQGTIG